MHSLATATSRGQAAPSSGPDEGMQMRWGPDLSERGRQRTREPLEALAHPLARLGGASLHVVRAARRLLAWDVRGGG